MSETPPDPGALYYVERNPPFSGARNRLDRVTVHLRELELSQERLGDEMTERIQLNRTPGGDLRVRLEGGMAWPVDMPVVIGEAVYNIRSALDSLVYDLAVRAADRERVELTEQTQFLIEDEEASFDRKLNGRMPRLTQDELDAIRSVQPFKGVTWTATLRDLSNQDKHRFLPELRVHAQFDIEPSAEGQERTDVHTSLIVLLHPQLVPLIDTLYEIQGSARTLVEALAS